MKNYIPVFTLLLAFLLASCIENSVIDPLQTDHFLFKIKVTDQFRRPLGGIQVSVSHRVSSRRWLGYWGYVWVVEDVALSVYKYRLIYRTPDDLQLIRETTNYLPLGSYKEEDAVIGYTSNDGLFRCNNELRFPNIFDDNELSVYISDTVCIILRDTLSDQYTTYKKIICNGKNEFNLAWNKRDVTPGKYQGWEREILNNHAWFNRSEVLHPQNDVDSCGETRLSFDVNAVSLVSLMLYDLHDEIRRIVFKDQLLNPGSYEIDLLDGCWWKAKYNRCY